MGRFTIALAKADKEFSMYIRRRDADSHTGRANCCTCGKNEHWSDMDCGHWIKRGVMITRFDIRNAHAQCRDCNRFQDGKFEAHERHLLMLYGWAETEELREKSKKADDAFRPSVDWLLSQMKMYRTLNKEL